MSKPLGHTVNGAQHVVTAHQDASNHNCSRIANGMASGIPVTYDPIGNRVSASETIGGEMLLKSYTANELNQYTTIANSAAVGLRGDATNTAVVTVNGLPVQSDAVASDTVPWHFALEADNASGSDFPFAEIMAVVNPPGTNTPDIISTSSGHLYAPPQTETLTYDDDGNMLSDGRWHYTWNGENRLIKAEELLSPTNRQPYTVKYAYDHRGRMVWKQISTNAVVVSTRTLNWDDYNIIAETVAQDTATNVTYNIWGLDLSGSLQGAGGVGGLLAVVRDDETSFLTYDANGNITEYLSADGTIVAHYEYSPFGEIIVQSGDLADSFTHRFSTKPWCGVTGLSEYELRKYSPSMGRWMSRDPIGEGGGGNLYGFNSNSPASRIDKLGRISLYLPLPNSLSLAHSADVNWLPDFALKLMYELTQDGEIGKAILQKLHFEIEYIERGDCQLKKAEVRFQEWFRSTVADNHSLDWTGSDVCYIQETRWATYGITAEDAPAGFSGYANMGEWSGVLDYYYGNWTEAFFEGKSDDLTFSGPVMHWGYRYTFKKKCCCDIREDVEDIVRF